MQKVIKLTTLILLTSMIIGLFVSCGLIENTKEDTTGKTETTDNSETTGEFTENNKVIAVGGVAKYKIIRPDYESPDKDFLNAYLTVKNAIEKKGDCTVELGVDFKRANQSFDSETYEILVGNTAYDETQEVMDSIDYYEFAIRVVGNKIVIAAHTKELIIMACNYFAENILAVQTNSDNKSELIYLGDYSEKSTDSVYFTRENEAKDYVIIYPSNNKNKSDAERLAKFFLNTYELEIEVKPDSFSAAKREILIGATNRAESTKYIGSASQIDTLTQFVKLEGYKIVLAGKADFATAAAVDSFIKLIKNTDYTSLINISNKTDIQDVAFSGVDSNKLADGANLRIMSYNILSEEFNDKLPLTNRDNYVAATIMYYSPDVIGIQEVSQKWYTSLMNLLEPEYTFINIKNSKNQYNYSGMAYNSKKVKLLESGTDIFKAGNSTRLRLSCWGYFEKLDTKERFVVVNTHWCIIHENRVLEAQEMVELIDQYRRKYNCPIFTTGDYNANINSVEYNIYANGTGFKNAMLDAKVKNRRTASYHTVGILPGSTDYARAIDHIFYSKEIECLYYNILLDQIVLDSSDHCPIYADFILK